MQRRAGRKLDQPVAPPSAQLSSANKEVSEQVAESRQSDARLRLNELELRRTTDAIPTFIHVLRPDGTVLYVNQAVLDYTGLTLEDVRKADYRSRVFHPADVERLREKRRHGLARPLPFENEQRVVGKDGKYRWFLVRYNPLLDEQGRIVQWYAAGTDITERKQTEERLRRSEAFIAEGQRLSSTGSLSWKVATDEITWSEELYRIYEFEIGVPVTLELIRGRVHPEDLSLIEKMKMVAQARTGSNDFEWRWRLVMPDRSIKYLHAVARPTRDGDGQLEYIAAVQDVTQQHYAQAALQEAFDEIQKSEAKLRHVIDTIPTLAWCNLPDGTNEFLNKNWHEYTGLSPEKSHGWGWQATVHPEDLPALMERWQEMLASGEPGEIEARLRRQDGVYRWFLIRAEPFRDEAGRVVRWYGTGTDIDDRKRAEQQLRRSEAFLAEGQHLARIGNFSWRVATDEILWSEQLYRIFQFEQGTTVTLELIGSRVHPEDVAMLNDMIDQARKGVSNFEYEHRLLLPDQTVKYLHLIAHGIRDNEDRLEYIGAVQDVTQRHSSEEALAKARSELARVSRVMSLATLTASIAHEVNQPLSGIVTNASTCLRMLSSDPPNIEGARETARRTIRDGNRASDVITRLRTLFSKKDAAFEALDLNETAREVIALCLSELQRNRVVLRTELAAGLPSVSGDRVQLQQVILNLLRNGSEAMHRVDDRPRDLLVTTRQFASDSVCLTVKDAGVGFKPEALDKLFEAFYTTKADGMGIGLSISRSIIEGHHGRLWAAQNNGPGAMFCFSIPCASESSMSNNNKAAGTGAA